MLQKKLQKSLAVLLVLAFALAMGAALPTGAAAADQAFYVYYTHGGTLYRTRTDGKGSTESLATNTVTGHRAKRSGNILLGMSGNGLVRSNLAKAPHAQAETVASSAQSFDVKGAYVYYVKKSPNSSAYRLYRMQADVDASKTGYAGENKFYEFETELATNIAYPYTQFKMLDGYIYFSALKDGREVWIGRVKEEGGSVKWICPGAMESTYMSSTSTESLYIVVNSDPEETTYSTDCMVAYKINRSSGKATALNKKYPIDHNDSTYGGWAGQIYYYNSGVEMVRMENSFDEYPSYYRATGQGIDMSGRRFTIDKNGAVEMVKTTGDTYVYCDKNGDVFYCTIKSGKVSGKKQIKNLEDIYYVRSLKQNGKRVSTLLAGASGTFLLKDDMSYTKLTGVNWDIVYMFDDIDGILYSNAGDEGRLYWMSADGKTNRRLSDVKPTAVAYIEKVN